jgi:molecular chaperone Hsp33
MSDVLDRFLFENRPVRGEIVTLEQSFNEVLGSSNYPDVVQHLLGELMAATSLLTATLKFEGEISLQIQSEGPIKYAVINGTHDQKLRGIARWDEKLDVLPEDFAKWFTKGVLAITLAPKNGQRYQGMVALDKVNLSACIEEYFLQSEQLLTKVKLMTSLGNTKKAAGLLIQIVPTTSETMNVESNADFEHVAHLAETATAEEMLSLSHKDMLYRLYHDEQVRVFDPQTIVFSCDCSKERSANALKSVSKNELLDIVKEEGQISMNCQFCHAIYTFDGIDVENIHRQNLDSGSA